jgi:2-dehydro-3-deoxyphosphogluconate aldolase / (4S)-4-hydroxy-2-oxoglutarate aldolase
MSGTATARLRAERVVGILRKVPPARVDPVVDALVAGGIGIVEITLESDGALDAITRMRERGGLLVAAGTVRTPEDVDRALAAGAELMMGPTLRADVMRRARERGAVMIPGAFTPTEIEAALGLGAPAVKLFPGSVGGPAYLRAVLAPLGDVPIVVTGGVDATTAPEFLSAGAMAVGTGSSVVSPARVAAGDMEAVAEAARVLVEAVRAVPRPS